MNPGLDPAALAAIQLSRVLGQYTARVLARQGVVTFADIHGRSDEDLLALRCIGPVLLSRLRRLTTILLTKGQLPAERRSVHPWDRLDTDDPSEDLLIATDLLTSGQRETLAAVSLWSAVLDPDTVTNAALFGCRTLLDVADLPPARIACFTPKTFGDLRARLQQALEHRVTSAEAVPVVPVPVFEPQRHGEPVPATQPVPAALRECLRDIPLAVLKLSEQAFQGLRADGLTAAYDLASRAPDAIARRYAMTEAELADLKVSLRHTLLRSSGEAHARSELVGHGALSAWIAPDETRPSRRWMTLSPPQNERLARRPVGIGQAGLTARAAEAAIAAGFTTLAALAQASLVQIEALFASEPGSLETLRHRIESLARYARPAEGSADQDVDILRQDGFGPDLCEALAFAGSPTLGLAARADLSAIPAIPAEITPSLRRAILKRLTPSANHPSGRAVLDVDPAALAWLRTQPLAALDAPGLRKAAIHRLRQAGFSDLAGLACADRATLPRLRHIGPEGADLIAARLQAILAETPFERRSDQARAA